MTQKHTVEQKTVLHPAKYHDDLLPIFKKELQGYDRVLDPFAGTGKLKIVRPDAYLLEIEPEWAAINDATVGNALDMPWPDGYFDAVCTSPCLTTDQRILTENLEWIECKDIKVGDRLIAFEEYPSIKTNGITGRRKYQIAIVEQSYTTKKRCVKITLENGDVIKCSYDHPFLANRYAHKSKKSEWIPADKLKDLFDPHLLKQFNIWTHNKSYEAGWVAGILDGEGVLSYSTYGSPKLTMIQKMGNILDKYVSIIESMGYKTSVFTKKSGHGSIIKSVYTNGGFVEIFSLLGSVRPIRLLEKNKNLDISTKSVEPKKIRVLSVEDIGEQEIQAITTSTGTYIGEGYLMHNTWGNRMADHHEAKDASKRNTYTHTLGRQLNPKNSGRLQWGDEYRNFHIDAWREVYRVLRQGGAFILNISDHIRKGEVIPVTLFHVTVATMIGFTFQKEYQVETPRQRQGRNGDKRVPYESIIVFRKNNDT